MRLWDLLRCGSLVAGNQQCGIVVLHDGEALILYETLNVDRCFWCDGAWPCSCAQGKDPRSGTKQHVGPATTFKAMASRPATLHGRADLMRSEAEALMMDYLSVKLAKGEGKP